MSAVAPQGTGEMTSTFSYAQAAKGRSPSQSATPSVGKSVSDVSEAGSKTEASYQQSDSPDSTMTLVGKDSSAKQSERSQDTDIPNGTRHEAETPALEHTVSKPQVNGMSPEISISRPHSPPSTNAPASAPPKDSNASKEEDVFATPNESDSTWDKISQESQNGDKPANKTEGDDDDSKLSSWEHLPAPAQLKEAPPPTFNIWQKRAQDLRTKDPKPAQVSRSTSSSADHGNGLAPTKPIDEGKLDGKRKSTAGRSVGDEKIVSAGTKDAGKGDGKPRSIGEEKVVGRSSKSPGSVKPTSAPPPPPTDAVSWPTPDLSKDEEKRKTQDRTDKTEPEKTPNKHVKEKWVQMPYVPSAVFSTPLPTTVGRRGGRGRGGGPREIGSRGGHALNGSVSGERATSGSIPSNAPAQNSAERNRGDMGPPKPGPLVPRPKRSSSAGPPTGREQRRPGDSQQEKRDESTQRSSQRNPALENRRVSSATQTEGARRGSPPDRRQQSIDPSRDSTPQDFATTKGNAGRRSEVGSRPQEFSRDPNGFPQSRERGEGRPERGRGGFRGRGNHNTFGSHPVNGQSFNGVNGSVPTPQVFPPSKSQSYTEQRHSSQPQPPFGAPREARHFRTNSRSQSIPNPAVFGRFPPNGAMQNPQAPPHLQTDAANMYYQQGPPVVMSAMPFAPSYMEHMQLASMVQMQMEYYFSLDNLVKDMFLRKHMDSQGFVFLSVLLNFNRIKQLSNDAELIRGVVWRSPQIEFQTGGDGLDRIRKAHDWKQWVLVKEDRDPSAQNDGPTHLYPPQLPAFGPIGNGGSPGSFVAPPYRSEPAMMNGQHPPSNQISDAHVTQTPLSASVPDFMPTLQPLSAQSFQPLENPSETTFSDEQIKSLTIVVRKQRSGAPLLKSPPPSASRTFSNGSIDPLTISDELSSLGLIDRQPAAGTNGDHAPESHVQDILQRSKSPFTFGTAPRQPGSAAPPVYWVKDKDTPIEDLPSDLTHELYTQFRSDAMKQREALPKGQPHHDLEILFQFWSHFLIRNFNAGMYEEFRRLAFEDASSGGSTVGLKNLITYYDESILSQKVVSDTITRDYAELVKSEADSRSNERPAFDKLRATFRNGALPLKNRIKVSAMLDPIIKAELDR